MPIIVGANHLSQFTFVLLYSSRGVGLLHFCLSYVECVHRIFISSINYMGDQWFIISSFTWSAARHCCGLSQDVSHPLTQLPPSGLTPHQGVHESPLHRGLPGGHVHSPPVCLVDTLNNRLGVQRSSDSIAQQCELWLRDKATEAAVAPLIILNKVSDRRC